MLYDFVLSLAWVVVVFLVVVVVVVVVIGVWMEPVMVADVWVI